MNDLLERLVGWYRVTSSTAAVVALVVANLIPLAGVLFLGWNVWAILVLYWLENGVVGGYNVARIIRAEGDSTGTDSLVRVKGAPSGAMAKAAIVPFFLVHYGIFWTVHGVFVLTLPLFGAIGGSSDLVADIDPLTIVLALGALVISHGVSFWFNYLGRGEYRTANPMAQMFAPYGRLVVLHVTIIFGAFAIAFLGAPAIVVAILVGLKTVLDLGFHLAEHRRRGATPATG